MYLQGFNLKNMFTKRKARESCVNGSLGFDRPKLLVVVGVRLPSSSLTWQHADFPGSLFVYQRVTPKMVSASSGVYFSAFTSSILA